MKIVTRPTVYVVGRQTVDDDQIEQFLAGHDVQQWQTDTEIAGQKLCEIAGRVCYMSFASPRPGGNARYLEHILQVGHGSVLEHAVWNLLVTNVSRSLTHELIRHRAGFGYSQLSQRYVDESQTDFVEPDLIAADPELHEIWMAAIRECAAAYQKLSDGLSARLEHVGDRTLRRKIARQTARSVLPNATETKIFVTANARALRHFIELRCNEHADTEIRKLAAEICRIMKLEAPNLFGDYDFVALDDGTQGIRTAYRKV